MAHAIKFDAFPKYLREGPWRVEAKATVVTIGLGLIWSWSKLTERVVNDPVPLSTSVRFIYGVGALHCISILIGIFRIGIWPMTTYTMLSWSFLTIRYTCSALSIGHSLSSVLRFASIAQNTVTVFIWWLVLVPIIRSTMDSPEKRKGFDKFNRSYLLINIHGINFLLSLIDAALLAPRRLTLTDLWFGIAFAYAYSLFYLGFLDPRGLHFYIILSPRTRLSPIIYSALLGLYWLIFQLWSAWSNHLIASACLI
mmetsp:Transcript_14940/g.19796  ORF Transcript_14940/g.19796 Transcript_14940/m.19796 type:complete len:254 (-) Transcript_14940:1251-2012(-)